MDMDMEMTADEAHPQCSTLVSRLSNGLQEEAVNLKTAGYRTQLGRLNRLLKLDTTIPKQAKRFNEQCLELVQKNPKLPKIKFKIDSYEEYLLHQIICKRPSLELVEFVYLLNPDAAIIPGFGGYSLFHHACWSHNSKQILEFLVKANPDCVKAPPFPPLMCAVDNITSMEVLEFLVKAYPEALCSSDVSTVTPLDIALLENLSLDVIHLFVSFFPRPELRVLKGSGRFLMPPEVAAVFAQDHPFVRTLDATYMRFTKQGCQTFFKVLAQNSTLEELLLDLTEEGVDPDVCEAMEKFMRNNDSLLKLRIRGRLLPTAFARALITGLSNNQTLEELSMEVCLDHVNQGKLLDCVKVHPHLNCLALKHCNVDSGNWDGIANLTMLERLDLSDSKIGPALAKPLAKLLETTTKLKELCVRNNCIGGEGTVLIARALEQNSSLEMLEYSHNDIDESGWNALVNTMEVHNKTVRNVGFAMDDPHYDTYYQRLQYYCDQNSVGHVFAGFKNQSPSPTGGSSESTTDLTCEDKSGPEPAVSEEKNENVTELVSDDKKVKEDLENDFTIKVTTDEVDKPNLERRLSEITSDLEDTPVDPGNDLEDELDDLEDIVNSILGDAGVEALTMTAEEADQVIDEHIDW